MRDYLCIEEDCREGIEFNKEVIEKILRILKVLRKILKMGFNESLRIITVL